MSYADLFLIKKHVIGSKNKLESICQPLDQHFAIHTFCYFSVDDKGNYTTLCNQAEATEYYHSEGFHLVNPLLASPDTVSHGMIFASEFQNQRFTQTAQRMEEKFAAKNPFFIIDHKGSSFDGFLFADSFQKDRHLFYMNHLDSLVKFIRYFKREARDLIGRSLADCLNLKESKGEKFYKNDIVMNEFQQRKQDFNNEILCLPDQQLRCLNLLQEGKIPKEIAAELHLSVRTVEYYLNIIKNKFNCSTQDLYHL